jgi:DNA-binding GntR family transcriptional regulator
MKTSDKPLREQIYHQLVEDIIRGRINAGEKILESDLAQRFKVSRTPAREALFQLEKDGYISHRKNIGAVVKKITGQKVQEIFDVVAQLEGYAVEKFVEIHRPGIDVSPLLKLEEQMVDLAKKKQFVEYQRVNIEFHQFFINRCENETLKETVMNLRNKVYKLVIEGLSLPANIHRYLSSHRKIIQTISSGNALNAGTLMRAHVYDSGFYLLKEIQLRDSVKSQ